MSDPTRHDSRYARDIVTAVDTITTYQSDHHPETELEERIHVDAVDRQLILIAEACGKLSDELKARHPNIDWKAISGFRTNIVHRYWQFDRNIADSVFAVHLDPLRNVADSESAAANESGTDTA